MEVLIRPSVTTKTHFFSGTSAFSPTPSLPTLHKKTRFKLRKTHFQPLLSPPFATNSGLPRCRIPRIMAHFGRPSNRRNSLRKKLTQDLQVRQNLPKIIDPLHNSVDNGTSESNLASTSLEQGIRVMDTEEIKSVSTSLAKSERLSDSVLWNKLDSWVEQYKKDIDFWGIGCNPIFTVFRDSSGIVERVVVDEDEIVRRSGREPLHFREERELGDFGEVNLKIAHAKFLAREMESGKDVVPTKSSVVKFVATGENPGFVSRIRSISVRPNLLPKVSRVSIALACGFLFVWAVKKLFTLGGDETEVTRFEKEMLRRKIKARMEKEKLQEGSVEVVAQPSEQPDGFTERPHLDREKLLNSIREAKGLNNELPVLNNARARDVASVNMDAEIQEIQIMARHARKIEREGHSSNDTDESDKQTSDKLPKMEDVAEEPTDSVNSDAFKIQASNELPAIEKISAQEQAKGHMNQVNNFSDGSFTKPRFVNGITKTDVSGNKEPEKSDGSSLTGEKVFERNEDAEPESSSSGRIGDDDNGQIDRMVDNQNSSSLPDSTVGLMSSEVCNGQQTSTTKAPVRKKPKIILSVRKAREYLSKKHDRKPQVSDLPSSVTMKNEEMDNHNEGMDNHTSERLRDDGKAPESSILDGVSDPILATIVCESYGVKENGCLSTDINEMNNKAQIRLMQNSPEPGSTESSSIGTILNLDNMDKIDGMFKHRNASEPSNIIPDESSFPDTSLKEKEDLPTKQSLDNADKLCDVPSRSNLGEVSDLVPGRNACDGTGNSSEATDIRDVNSNEMLTPGNAGQTSVPVADGNDLHVNASEKNAFRPVGISSDKAFGNNEEGKLLAVETTKGSESGGDNKEGGPFADNEKWLEKNFHEVEPLVKKIGSGFKNNYMVAREKVKEEMDIGFDFTKLRSLKDDDTELEWMQDDKLRDIIFRVRDNELAGRDPFHSMDPEDKVAFFKGLERKVKKENKKLATLHEWLHSNIENLDYGADGISIYDPPEKVIPRWKGPPIDKIPEFLSNAPRQQQEASFLRKADESPKHDNKQMSKEASINKHMSEEASITKSRPKNKVTKTSKTVIEASDGSIKSGKRSGKEFWQHTKKWSPGFVESYNAETDPEVKSVMKDIGKDLDRWITEKEIQEAADLMDKIPQRGKEIIEKKLSKVRREMELFGPAAVVSKYREYAEEKEQDYLWWLDLPYVLCIELYTYEGEEQRVGFYSLEMATDLDINPKPNHVIAFEDPGDCKNLCYIIQAHLEMLGSGQAFVVAQIPKDAFRQAKANGFGVTVIRKGELQLNIDQPLEEVEELITEIGSKMYHDNLVRERSVDISGLMKGVFGISEPPKRRRKKRALKKPKKP